MSQEESGWVAVLNLALKLVTLHTFDFYLYQMFQCYCQLDNRIEDVEYYKLSLIYVECCLFLNSRHVPVAQLVTMTNYSLAALFEIISIMNVNIILC